MLIWEVIFCQMGLAECKMADLINSVTSTSDKRCPEMSVMNLRRVLDTKKIRTILGQTKGSSTWVHFLWQLPRVNNNWGVEDKKHAITLHNNSQFPIIWSIWDLLTLYLTEKINGFFFHVFIQSFLEPSKHLASTILDTRTSTTWLKVL